MRHNTSPEASTQIWDRLVILRGDITESTDDVIVNAASHSLLGLSGVSGAVFNAAGPALYEECKSLRGCAEGEAKITSAYDLSARHIIHTVAPVWREGTEGETKRLAQCYRSSFELVVKHGHRTVTIPSIGTGAHGFPVEKAAQIALEETCIFLTCNSLVKRISLVCFDDRVYRAYLAVLEKLKRQALMED